MVKESTTASPNPGGQPPKLDKTEEREGSFVLGACTILSVLGIFLSVGFGIYLIAEGSFFSGIIVGCVGSIYNCGLFLVFCEVNRIIGERKVFRPPFT